MAKRETRVLASGPKRPSWFEKGNYWSNNYLNTASYAALGLLCGAPWESDDGPCGWSPCMALTLLEESLSISCELSVRPLMERRQEKTGHLPGHPFSGAGAAGG